ncbi:hypothetical protein GCM10010407_14010 [Rarobacter incanus]
MTGRHRERDPVEDLMVTEPGGNGVGLELAGPPDDRNFGGLCGWLLREGAARTARAIRIDAGELRSGGCVRRRSTWAGWLSLDCHAERIAVACKRRVNDVCNLDGLLEVI